MPSIEDNIVRTTMQIEAISEESVARGTGFQLSVAQQAYEIPLLVTNKHVVSDADSLKLHFSLSDTNNHNRKVGIASCHITGNWRSLWIPHPDENVDLGALAIAPMLIQLLDKGKASHGVPFLESHIIDARSLAELTPIEDILMVGYPIGLRDTINNQPIVRRGTTATNPKVRFQGRDEFLIDCACWPGSSGSPILIKPQSFKFDGDRILARQSPIFLAGVLYSGPVHLEHGSIDFQPIPTASIPFSTTRQMIHLGNVINAKKIRELANIVKELSDPDGMFALDFEFKNF